jgi:hypothetical protein
MNQRTLTRAMWWLGLALLVGAGLVAGLAVAEAVEPDAFGLELLPAHRTLATFETRRECEQMQAAMASKLNERVQKLREEIQKPEHAPREIIRSYQRAFEAVVFMQHASCVPIHAIDSRERGEGQR